MSEMTRIKRSDFASFINIGTKAEPVWARMGKGITEQSVAYNPTTTSETYIDENNATTSVDGYAPTISTPQIAYKGNPVFDYVDKLRQERAIGSDCESQVMLVYIYDKDSTGKYKAEVNNCSLSIEEFGGPSASPLSLQYTVNLNGDPILGLCQIVSGVATFTANS